jgi:rubredoxin
MVEPRYCPECGTEIPAGSFGEYSANEFCRGMKASQRCDFPLFWAPEVHTVAVATEELPGSRKRMPGVSGRDIEDHLVCPHCDEPNEKQDAPPAGEVGPLCTRCSLPLFPKPIVVVAPQPPPAIVVAPPLPPPAPPPVVVVPTPASPARRAWWPWITAGAIVSIGLVVLIQWIV